VNCDNSQVSNNVKSFKIKLFRKYKAIVRLPGKKPRKISNSEYVKAIKLPGIKAKQNAQLLSLELKIPMLDPESKRPLAGTLNGVIIKIKYELRIFVKHDNLLALGEGACVKVPLIIYDIPHKPFVNKILKKPNT
jgi:hypothetical protein